MQKPNPTDWVDGQREETIAAIAKRGIKSVLASAAQGMLMGFGLQSSLLALDAMLDLLQKRNG